MWSRARNLVTALSEDESKLEAAELEVVQGLKTGRECLMEVTVGGWGPGSIGLSGTGVFVADGNIVVPSSDIAF